MNSLVGKKSRWPKEPDLIFELSERAQAKELDLGKDKVINATIGALMDDNGDLITMNSVFDTFKGLPNALISAYAPIVGTKGYCDTVKKVLFKGNEPDAHMRIVASPGGSGSIKLGMYNYTNEGDIILTCDWYWSPYQTIAEEAGRNVDTYTLFNDKGEFNIESFTSKCDQLLNRQGRLFAILNSPGHNPTGYSIADDEWDKILDYAKSVDSDKPVVLFVDVAYIDFVKDDIASRKFFKKFSNLPDNILIIVGFSMSKGYTAYGMRCGAAIGISSNEEIADEFYYSLMHSARANWSNGNHGAMETLTAIYEDEQKAKKYEEEKNKYKQMLVDRAEAFVEASKECGLEILPYRDGFFVSIPCKNPKAICEKLTEENLFLVPLGMGLRFAVCAVEESKCKKAPKLIKEAIDQIEG